ncbi:class I SAM-dependent methyltransferase [Sediminibacillus halophilus]|uniref:Methyltransferase domain-containing protein n=1 Tax=Sediminibacillus halophilus TaxID=482461 RepID=A0A1G9P9B5_9BACI|nr:class I SAM-dependent methyltransferase [Sediminibacillus halophilus]SDL95462.1 Methyltransferase domain-containing protein [Sediminibacillus halophilus]
MGKWFPIAYDFFMKPLEKHRFKDIRSNLLAKAKGRVLEIGSGSGINLPHYQHSVEHVVAIDPNEQMLQRSVEAVRQGKVKIQLLNAEAEKLPFADNTFDTVVATLVFCTVADPEKVILEIKRVSKPGARILLFEHVKVSNPFWAKVQDRLTPIWKRVCDGCHLNRNTLGYFKQAGLSMQEVKKYYKGTFITVDCLYQPERKGQT